MTNKLFYIGSSNIHGKGVFANSNLLKATIIGVMCYYYNPLDTRITTLGKAVNHLKSPNCFLYQTNKNTWVLVTNKNINDDTELTINYGKNPFFLKTLL